MKNHAKKVRLAVVLLFLLTGRIFYAQVPVKVRNSDCQLYAISENRSYEWDGECLNGYLHEKEIMRVYDLKDTLQGEYNGTKEKLREHQNILVKIIEGKRNLFNIPAEDFNVNISTIAPAPYGYYKTSFQIVVTVVWTDKNQKAYAMVGEMHTSEGIKKQADGKEIPINFITLQIREGDLSLASEVVLKDLKDFVNYNSEQQLLRGYNIYDIF